MERRFHSPYKYWVSGLLTELAILTVFVLALVGIALLVAWIAG